MVCVCCFCSYRFEEGFSKIFVRKRRRIGVPCEVGMVSPKIEIKKSKFYVPQWIFFFFFVLIF